MSVRRYSNLLPLIVAFLLSPNVLHADSIALSRLSIDYKNYDAFPEASLGLKAGFSWTETSSWSARGTAYGLRRFGMSAFQGALGASYFVTPTWGFDLDADVSTNGSLLALYSITGGTGITISKAATPSFAYQYSYYSDAATHTLTPAFSWTIIPELDLTCKLNGTLTRYATQKTADTISGSAKATFSPYPYFSIFTGLSIGEEPFDPGDPTQPLSSYFAQKVSGGIKFFMEGNLGAEVNIDHEWRNNGQNVLGAEFAAFYSW